MRRTPILLVLALFATRTAAAQEPPSTDVGLTKVLTVGSRAELTTSILDGPVRGVVTAVDGKRLTLAPDHSPPLTLPLGSVTEAHVSLGLRRQTVRGALIGGLALGLLGLTFPVDPDDCGSQSESFCSRGEALGAGAFVGALLGAGIGALVPREEWARIRIERAP